MTPMSPSEASGKVERFSMRAIGGLFQPEQNGIGAWVRYDDHARIVADYEARLMRYHIAMNTAAVDESHARLEAAERRCEELEGDAARYRWLKMQSRPHEQREILSVSWCNWDAYCDAALAARQASAKGGE